MPIPTSQQLLAGQVLAVEATQIQPVLKANCQHLGLMLAYMQRKKKLKMYIIRLSESVETSPTEMTRLK